MEQAARANSERSGKPSGYSARFILTYMLVRDTAARCCNVRSAQQPTASLASRDRVIWDLHRTES
jgi:hypothetical protein